MSHTWGAPSGTGFRMDYDWLCKTSPNEKWVTVVCKSPDKQATMEHAN